jgi:hypothetical protein
MTYNLSIACVDGDTIYGLISSDKTLLRNFLREHDHEGSSISLIGHEGDAFEEIPYDNIYTELGLRTPF